MWMAIIVHCKLRKSLGVKIKVSGFRCQVMTRAATAVAQASFSVLTAGFSLLASNQ
jgi:hypothetical protein